MVLVLSSDQRYIAIVMKPNEKIPRGAGISSHLPLAEGDVCRPPPCLTSELIGRVRSARWQSKALNKGILIQS